MNVAERICSLLDETESLKREISQKTFRIADLESDVDRLGQENVEAYSHLQELRDENSIRRQEADNLRNELVLADDALDAAVQQRDNAQEALHYKEEQVKRMDLEISRLRETPIWAENEGIVYDIAYLEPLRTKLEEALKDEYKIQALKILREATKCSLPVAKKVVERMQEVMDNDISF